ncbi:MarR family transcriptional regulator (plasmid) [Halolamina sp. CBA1230]|uniref:winged helix-turn-helix transcriptional regulator n=1 Tax=Halolamina sp. CBA1230 TaxID=1853690 RepID=UPI0009A23B2C|nr:winged helix-turn-helix transcriptional regulator [Halolamina sp. CBA1230]QKY22260.1 MarR family transcriptional regulator [Halolamina sp. CBA1230]
MRLVRPTDFHILEHLSDGNRNTASNIAKELEKDRSYINTRLPALANQGLITKVGPDENSGLYEITQRGYAVLELRGAYGHSEFNTVFELADENT